MSLKTWMIHFQVSQDLDKTRVRSYNLYVTPFSSFPSHLTLVKFIKLKRTQSVCTREKEKEKEEKERKKVFNFF